MYKERSEDGCSEGEDSVSSEESNGPPPLVYPTSDLKRNGYYSSDDDLSVDGSGNATANKPDKGDILCIVGC